MDRTNVIEMLKQLEKEPDILKNFLKNEFEFSDESKNRLQQLIYDFKNKKFRIPKDQGDCLEKIATFLFKEFNKYFIVKNNVKTDNNEIDVLIVFNSLFYTFHLHSLFEINKNSMLVECKNYNKKIDVTWVGKFAHILHSHDTDFGIIISKHPLTGLNKGLLTWNNAAELPKVYLKFNKKIINLTLEDLEKIANGNNFIDIIQEKIMELKFDTEINLIESNVKII